MSGSMTKEPNPKFPLRRLPYPNLGSLREARSVHRSSIVMILNGALFFSFTEIGSWS